MKVRIGFVSNSSSSSFVCEVCGEKIEGWDISLMEGNFYSCTNEHIICEEDLLKPYSYDVDEEDPAWDEEMTYHYNVPEEYCPICMFVEPDYDLLKKHLIKLYGISEAEVFEKVKSENKKRKKLYSNEYVAFVLAKKDINQQDLMNGLKTKYSLFSDFRKEANR